MERQKYKVKSADRVLDIFELFIGDQESYTLTEVAKKLNAPASSTYVIMQNMLERGFLETDASGKKFMLGHKLNALRNHRLTAYDLSGEFHRVADEIFHDLNETMSLSVRMGDKLLYLANKTSTHHLRFNLYAGNTHPVHSTASGKVLLSGLSEEELRALFPADELAKVTEKTISTFPELLKELEKVRREGFGYNSGETVDGVYCVAAPIYDVDGKMIAAVSISIPQVRITDDIWKRVHHNVKYMSRELSGKKYDWGGAE